MLRTRSANAQAFTLIELLVVIAIIALLAAILFPVFANAREKARQTTCESNEKQLGLAFLQYTQDFDELYPQGANGNSNGLCWAGPLYAYTKSIQVFQCPDDSKAVPTGGRIKPSASSISFTMYPIAYSVNENLLAQTITIGSLTLSRNKGLLSMNTTAEVAPASTVLLYEEQGDFAPINDPQELRNNGIGNRNNEYYSPAGNGITYQRNGGGPNDDESLATGVLGGAIAEAVVKPSFTSPCAPNAICFLSQLGTHDGGSDYVFADGHVKWLPPSEVSPGWTAASPTDAFDATKYGGASAKQPSAAGTGNSQGYVATFSPI